MKKKLKILGVDPAFAQFGLVWASVDIKTLKIKIQKMQLLKTKKSKVKQVRKSSDRLYRGRQLFKGFFRATHTVDLVVGEVPSGSQSAVAASGLGVAVGVLASCYAPFIEVSPKEVKEASTGNKNATKEEMIEWATSTHPYAEWLTKKRKSEISFIKDNEHLADALGAIYAGLNTETFKSARKMFMRG